MSRLPRAWRWFYWSLACYCLALGLCGCSRPATPGHEPTQNQKPRAIVIQAAYYAPTKSGIVFDLDPSAAWMVPVLDAAKAEISARGRAWWHVDVLRLSSTADVAAATGKPQFENGREVVSRANTGSNVVYLSRPSAADLAHELGHLWLRSTSCADAEAFAAAVLARLERPSARVERGVRAMLTGNVVK